MAIDWEQLFTDDTPYNMQLLIEVSGGTYLTNTEIAQESFSLTEMLSDSTDLRFGGCNASQLRLRIRSSVTDTTGKTIVVKLFAYEDPDIRIVIQSGTPVEYNKRTEEVSALTEDFFLIGTYRVRTDKPTPDKDYRDLSAFDALERVINEDVAKWYSNFYDTYDSVTLKFLRESLLDYFGITYEAFTGVNDSVTVGKVYNTPTLSAKTILCDICELNGCFGYITRDNKFRCKVLSTETVDKEYLRYKQGQINYQDALANVITQVFIVNEVNKAQATIGIEGNTYIINSNTLVSGLKSAELETIASRLLPVISSCVYRPFTCVTYGDPCTELGDFIEIPTSDKTVESFLLYRELTGTQAMRDKLEAKGEEYNASGATGSAAVISQLNSQMSQVKGETELSYYIFRSATAMTIEDGEDPTRIARIRYANTGDTNVDIWHEFKLDTSISEGSDRCKVYAYFYYDGNLLSYQPIETYGIDDYHMLNLLYAFPETQEGYHTWEVFLATEGGDVTIGIDDAGITLRGQGIITQTGWDGILNAEDEITAILGNGGFVVTGITENVGFDWKDVEFVNASDTVSAILGNGGFVVNITDSANIITQKDIYKVVSEDGTYQLISEDGEYHIESEE